MKEDKTHKDRRYRINELRAKSEKMTSRERTRKAINFEEPDRMPIDNWMVPEIKQRCMEYWGCENEEELLAFLGVDIRDNYGASYVGQEFKKYDDGTVEDLWGVRRRIVTYGKGIILRGDIQGSLLVSAGTYEERGRNQFLYPLALTRLVGLFQGEAGLRQMAPEVFRTQQGRPAGQNGSAQTDDVYARHSANLH